MVLVANEKWMLTYNPEKVLCYTACSMFTQGFWAGSTLQSRVLKKFFSEAELRRARAKLAAEKRVRKKFVS